MSTDSLRSSQDAARWPQPQKIGNYKVIEELGEGAHGVVYKCWDDAIRRYVAIKVLKPTVHSRERHLRLKREGEILGRLNHRNIVAVHTSGLAEVWIGESAYLVTDFVDGVPIDEYLREKPDATRISILEQLLDGVGHAHREGFVHCDLKPANLLVDKDGVLKILDFGIAKVFCDGFSPLTVDPRDAPFGTPSFMAPEQIERNNVDVRSDVFSVGAVFYFIDIGEPPLVPLQAEGWEVYKAIEKGTISKLSGHDGVSDLLAQAIDCSLERNPDERFQSAEEFKNSLRVLSTSTSRTEGKSSQLPRTAIFLSAIVLLVIVALAWRPQGAGLGGDVNGNRTRKIRDQTHDSRRLQNVDHPEDFAIRQTTYTSGVASCAGFAPDNPVGGIEWLHDVNRCAKEDREFSWHFLLWCYQRTHRKKPYPHVVTALRWDEARQRFYFGDNQGNLGYYSKSMHEQVELESALGSRTNDISISPDGSTMVAVTKKGAHAFYDLASMERLPLRLAEDVKLCRSIWYTSDGENLITIQRTGRVAIWSTKDGMLLDEWNVGHEVTSYDVAPSTGQIAVASPQTGFRIGNITEKTWSEVTGKEKVHGLRFDKHGESLLVSTPGGFSLSNTADLQNAQRYPLTEKFRPLEVIRSADDSHWVYQGKTNGLCFVRQREKYRIARLIQCGVAFGYDVTDDGRWVVYGHHDRNVPNSRPVIGRWDLRPWKAGHVLQVDGKISAVSCSTNGQRFAIVAEGGLKQVELKQPQPSLLQHAEGIQAICKLENKDIAYATKTEVVVIRNGIETRNALSDVLQIVNEGAELLLASRSGDVFRFANDNVHKLGTCDGPQIWLGEHDEAVLALSSAGALFRFLDGSLVAKFDLGINASCARLVGEELFVVGGKKLLRMNISRSEMTETELDMAEESTLVAISPDGKTLAYADSLGTLGFLDPVIGTKRFEFHKCFSGPPKGVDFSPDGKVIYVVGSDDKIHVWTPSESD